MTSSVPETVRRFLHDLTRRLGQDQGDNLVEVRLFGSHARGDARPDSDVDVLVVVEETPLPVKDRILEILADAALDHELAGGPSSGTGSGGAGTRPCRRGSSATSSPRESCCGAIREGPAGSAGMGWCRPPPGSASSRSARRAGCTGS